MKLFGFKSFAGKVEVKLGAGITGILGPNGCGKSNIADAVRWVLGEQSAKHLRGASMEDVIFKGTRDRKPLGMAEVYLSFKNDQGIMPIEYTDVQVGRRLFRSGQSDYLINKAPSRLKDVRGLFLDSGLGVQAYSIFERQMIDEILNDASPKRREMFEEASGIMKYKIRRKEALRKLDSSNRDLERVNDLISEIEREVRSLSRQVGRARRYRRLKEETRDLDTAVSARRIARVAERRRALEGSLDESSGKETGWSAELRTGETDLEQLRMRMLEVGEQLQRARRELAERQETLSSSRQRREVLTERREGLERSIEELGRQVASEELRAGQLEREIAVTDEELIRQEASVNERQTALSAEERILQELESLLAEKRGELGKLQQMTLDLKEAESERRHALARERMRLEELSRRRERVTQDRTEAGERRETLREKQEARSKEHARLVEELSTRRSRAADLREQRDQEARALEADVEIGRETSRELASVTSRLDTLEDLRTSYEGYDSGVRALLLDPPEGVLGALTDVIKADASLSAPLEAALGGAMQGVVVRDADVALSCIEHLSREEQGRVTFCPVAEMTDPPARAEAPGRCLADLVTPRDEETRPVVEAILGRTFLVDTAPEARSRSREFPALTWVTPRGDAFHDDRRVSGGGASLGRKLLQREAEITSLEGDRDRLQAEVTEIESRAATRREALAVLDRDAETVAAEIEETARLEAETGEAARRLEFESTLTTEELTGLESELTNLASEAEEIEARIRQEEAACHEAAAAGEEHAGEWEERSAEVNALEERREEKLREVGDLRVSYVQATAELQSTRARHERLDADRTEALSSRTEKAERIDESKVTIAEIDAELERLATAVRQVGPEIETASNRVDTLVGEEVDLQNDWSERDKALKELRGRVQEERETLHKLELELSSLSGEGGRIRERLFDEYRVVLLEETDDRGLPLVVRHDRRRVVVRPGDEEPDAGTDDVGESTDVEAMGTDGADASSDAEVAAANGAHPAASNGAPEVATDAAADATEGGSDTGSDEEDLGGIKIREEEIISDPLPADPPQRYQGMAEEEWPEILAELRQKLQNFGPVNEMAVEDYDIKKERLDFLTGQRDDLVDARDALLETIRKVNREARERFMATFELAQKNFVELHAILFPGGHADLRLEGDDPLEGDIVMIARPKGKRVETIKLLSSGERALTAIALIFAIYMIKPSPFCMLDEVDAPLDDANIDRFVQIIREFSKRTQFVIITHNKRTMEACDALYGVTMEEPGISKLVSVQMHGGEVHVDGTHAPDFVKG